MAYSNSNLVSYIALSPNHSGTRNHPIDKIAIHHMAGNLTVETCGNVFANTNREASSNYGVGTDGRIGLYVEEKNRAWTTGSYECDNRAVTIEVANCECCEPWPVSDTALESLINLCVDICRRNGITNCTYTGDKSGTLQMHKWYQATGCPGTYLSSKFDYIASEVNRRMNGGVTPTAPSEPMPTPADANNSDVDIMYAVRTQSHGWLPEVRNLDDFAGFEDSPITAITARVTRGSLKYRVHLCGGDWLPYVDGCDVNDHNNGYAGLTPNSAPIDAIEMYYYTPDGEVMKAVDYRVGANGNYYGWQRDNDVDVNQDGYAGLFGHIITNVQATITQI